MEKFNIPVPEQEKLMNYIKTRGNTGNRTLEILGKNLKFIDALNTEVGLELLKDLVSMHETAFQKVASLDATDEDKVNYKLLQSLINKWSIHISYYFEALQKVNTTVVNFTCK